MEPSQERGLVMVGGAAATAMAYGLFGARRRTAQVARAVAGGTLSRLLGGLGGGYYSLLTHGDSVGWGVFWLTLGLTFPPLGVAAGAYGVYQTYRRPAPSLPDGGAPEANPFG